MGPLRKASPGIFYTYRKNALFRAMYRPIGRVISSIFLCIYLYGSFFNARNQLAFYTQLMNNLSSLSRGFQSRQRRAINTIKRSSFIYIYQPQTPRLNLSRWKFSPPTGPLSSSLPPMNDDFIYRYYSRCPGYARSRASPLVDARMGKSLD